MNMKIKMAGLVFAIEYRYPSVAAYCQDYFTEETEDYFVCIGEKDLEEEREWLGLLDKNCSPDRAAYSADHVELLALHRKIASILLEHNILLFHGSAIAVDGKAYLFTAVSGTGKSTHTALWRKYFGERALMVNDDKPWIRLGEKGASIIGSPWNGKHRLSTDIEVPLKAICILERGEENYINEITAREAWPMLFQQTHHPPEQAKMTKTLQLVDILSQKVKLYRLHCNMDLQAAEIAFAGMQS